MTKYEELMSKTKAQLKDLITKESSQEEINKITSIDKTLDELQAENERLIAENSSLKDSLIESVKNTGFKVSGKESDDIGVQEETKSLDDVMAEELAKIQANRR